eukprot:3136535-Rhodomonas_salina.1
MRSVRSPQLTRTVGLQKGILFFAEDSITHPDDFLELKGVHPKRGCRVVPAQECPLQRSVCVGLVQLDQWMVRGEVVCDIAAPDLNHDVALKILVEPQFGHSSPWQTLAAFACPVAVRAADMLHGVRPEAKGCVGCLDHAPEVLLDDADRSLNACGHRVVVCRPGCGAYLEPNFLAQRSRDWFSPNSLSQRMVAGTMPVRKSPHEILVLEANEEEVLLLLVQSGVVVPEIDVEVISGLDGACDDGGAPWIRIRWFARWLRGDCLELALEPLRCAQLSLGQLALVLDA